MIHKSERVGSSLVNFRFVVTGVQVVNGFTIGRHEEIGIRCKAKTNHDKLKTVDRYQVSLKVVDMSVQRFELYQFSAVEIFLKLLKRRIGYYTKKVQQSDQGNAMIGPNEKFSFRLIRSKLRKREESSGIHRTNVVHPEGVLQATIVGNAPATVTAGTENEVTKGSPLEDIFIAPVSNRKSFNSWNSDNSLSGYSSETTQLPMFLYSTANSRNSLNSNDQVSLFSCFLSCLLALLKKMRRISRCELLRNSSYKFGKYYFAVVR